ncbi:MAG: pilus assembly protein [Oscillospiraceae bacterium]|jgi:hypothetical protein|nr:pilus assembly protein [Oscillospiraceae bacterium]
MICRGKRKIKVGRLLVDVRGEAVVEATILFPIMIMIFAALIILAIYLPAQSVLQRATQHAATVIATENSDTWLFYDEQSLSFYWESSKQSLGNVYTPLIPDAGDVQTKAEYIVRELEKRSISSRAGTLEVIGDEENKFIYREIIVTATRKYTIPVDLSFIGFPKTIDITASSTAVVNNANDFIRNIDLAKDFSEFVLDKFKLGDMESIIGNFGKQVSSILGG